MKYYRALININPNIRFGKPCIKNTRISVGDILGWLAAGMSNEEIIEDFPELTLEAIRAALAFARDLYHHGHWHRDRQSSVAHGSEAPAEPPFRYRY